MWHHAKIQPQWLAISVAKWDRKKRIGFVCAAFTLESRTGNVFFESLSPRLMRCKDHVAGGFSIRWSLHHFRKPIPIRFIIKLPFSCWFPSGSGISTSCMVSSWLIPFARRFCKMGSSTWDVWGPRVYKTFQWTSTILKVITPKDWQAQLYKCHFPFAFQEHPIFETMTFQKWPAMVIGE